MKNKIIIVIGILFVGYFLINEYYIKNSWCKTEGGRYEIWANHPIDITEKIKNKECVCISESLIIETKPKPLTTIQLEIIKKELPNWAINNIKGFSEKDEIDLFNKLKKLRNNEFLEKLKYKYTFIDDSYLTCFIPIYVFEIGSKKAYIPNYQSVYDDYLRLSKDPEGVKFLSKSKAPNYPIIESESWVKNFGDKAN